MLKQYWYIRLLWRALHRPEKVDYIHTPHCHANTLQRKHGLNETDKQKVWTAGWFVSLLHFVTKQ